MSHVAELREVANLVAETQPALGKRLHLIAARVAPMEELMGELIQAERDAEWRAHVEAQGVVALPNWGRA